MSNNEILQKSLLEKVKLIVFKHKQLEELECTKFNLFTILRDRNEEVSLHSRFLYEILSEKGCHGQGRTFLDLFLETAEISTEEFGPPVIVDRELTNIDLLIRSKDKALIIENKIRAGDQDKQLERYHDTVNKEMGYKTEDIYIFYLTPNGHEPSEQSLGTLPEDKVKCISYKEQIQKWMEKCIATIPLIPPLRETFVQYQKLIEELTGNNKRLSMEASDLLKNKETLEAASVISEALLEAKTKIQLDFLDDLSKAIKEKFPDMKPDYDAGKIRENYRRSGRASKYNRWYGISVPVKQLSEKKQLIFRFEVEDNLYYGFYIKCKNVEMIENEYSEIREWLKKTDFEIHSKTWPGIKYPESKIDFIKFDDNVRELLNPEFQQKMISTMVNDMTQIINNFYAKFGR